MPEVWDSCLPALTCLRPGSYRDGVVRVTGAHGGGGWEHSRGTFQRPLSNAWLWYSSWPPLKHTQSRNTQALSPRGFRARVSGSPTSSQKPPLGSLSKVGLPRQHLAVVFLRGWQRRKQPLHTSLTLKTSATQSKNTRGRLPLLFPYALEDLVSSL